MDAQVLFSRTETTSVSNEIPEVSNMSPPRTNTENTIDNVSNGQTTRRRTSRNRSANTNRTSRNGRSRNRRNGNNGSGTGGRGGGGMGGY